MKKLFLFLIILFLLAGFVVPFDVQAFSLMDDVSPECWQEGGGSPGNCNICDILRVIFNVGKFIFSSMAGIALLLMLWGTIGLILNWGSAEMVAANKKIIFHTLFAILIIMAAWTLVNALIMILSAENLSFWEAGSGKWWVGPDCK